MPKNQHDRCCCCPVWSLLQAFTTSSGWFLWFPDNSSSPVWTLGGETNQICCNGSRTPPRSKGCVAVTTLCHLILCSVLTLSLKALLHWFGGQVKVCFCPGTHQKSSWSHLRRKLFRPNSETWEHTWTWVCPRSFRYMRSPSDGTDKNTSLSLRCIACHRSSLQIVR